jgi:hypothetical protein
MLWFSSPAHLRWYSHCAAVGEPRPSLNLDSMRMECDNIFGFVRLLETAHFKALDVAVVTALWVPRLSGS